MIRDPLGAAFGKRGSSGGEAVGSEEPGFGSDACVCVSGSERVDPGYGIFGFSWFGVHHVFGSRIYTLTQSPWICGKRPGKTVGRRFSVFGSGGEAPLPVRRSVLSALGALPF